MTYHRFSSWFVQFLLSLTVLCACIDNIPPSQRGPKEKFTLATASISLALSFIITIAHLIGKWRYYLVGTLLELFAAVIPLCLWVVGTVFIQNPKNDFASEILLETGKEEIKYANLFFFSWILLYHSTHLVARIFNDYTTYDPQLSGWLILCTASLTLLGMSVTLKPSICEADAGRICNRTKFGIAIGVISSVLTFIAALLVASSRMGAVAYLFISFTTSAFHIFGVVILTSASGPATDLGTMYFSSWVGAIVSSLLFIGGINELFDAVAIEEEEMAAKTRAPTQYGDDDI